MNKSSSFIAALLSFSAMACAGSNLHTESGRPVRLPQTQKLGDLWAPAPESPSRDAMKLEYGNYAKGDLWNSPELQPTDEQPRRPTPRMDAFVSRLTQGSSDTFVEASQLKRAF